MTAATHLKQPRKGVVVREMMDADAVLPPVPAAAVPHTPEAVAAQYRLAMDGLRECLRFGAMLAEVEASLSRQTSLGKQSQSNQYVTCEPRTDTLKSWLSANCPEVDYGWALKYKRLAEGVAEACALPAAVPLSLAMGSGEAEGVNPKKLVRARAEVAAFLEGKSARQLEFAFGYRDAKPKGGDRRSGIRMTEEEKHLKAVDDARQIWIAHTDALVDNARRLKTHLFLDAATLDAVLLKLDVVRDELKEARSAGE